MFWPIIISMQRLKVSILYILKAIGLFKLSEYYSRKFSTVLCYHGISTDDENKFLPANYISFDAFKEQIETLLKNGYQFIDLDDLRQKMKSNSLSNKEIVLTIDDGFKSIFDQMIPYLEEKKIKSTLYVTTKESINKDSIFRLLCNYIFWKSSKHSLEINNETIFIKNNKSSWDYILKSEENLSFKEREILLHEIANKLEVNISNELKKSFQLINYDDLKNLDLKYVDIQLHTHSHDMTMEQTDLKKDIEKNIELLKDIGSSPLVHFCYPSGFFKNSDLPMLKSLNIKTATTCEQGMVSSFTNPLLIPRLIINSNTPQIVFEAELNGLMELIRKLKRA